MPEVFKTKIRVVGTSLGVLIPKKIAVEQNVKEGEEVEIALLKPDKKAVEKAFGIAKGKLKFEREHKG
ncbi:MAG: AbrB/MazE/SpoVT family DNA-binding domain-containing protein [Candidatus Aenigmatarchaeota archaeon]